MNGDSPAVSTRIVRGVMETTGRDQTELPVLYDCIDPDALDALVDRMADGEVSFGYAGCDVTVRSDETVSVERRQGPDVAAGASARSD